MNRESSNKRGKRNIRGSEPSLNLEEIREIARLVERYGFTDFEFENERIRVRLSKVPAPQIFQPVQPISTQMVPQPEVKQELKTEPQQQAVKSEETLTDEGLYKITSPIVGTFYRAPAPDKPPYVKIGDRVEPETVVCIVEAMKLMNEIQAGVSGEVVKIYVENGQPVEYGQPLFGIKV